MTTKVLHLLGSLRPSGMERMLVTAADHFRAADVTNIIVGQGKEHSFEYELRKVGHDVHVVEPIGLSLRNAKTFRKLVRGLGVDVVHIHTEANYLRTVLAARWALGRRGTIVRTIHSVFDAKGMWWASRFVQAAIADRFVAAVVAPSTDVSGNERRFWRRPVVIFNWVDDAIFSISSGRATRETTHDSTPTALIVGNCSGIKQHERALIALANAGHRLIHLGDERDAGASELSLLGGLQERGFLVERGVARPHEALARADYFMLPSRHEGMSVALAEAIVAGVPALVNDVQGLQWAKGVAGVTMVSDEQEAWLQAVLHWQPPMSDSEVLPPDLSAVRGAREYVEVYSRTAKVDRTRHFFSIGG